MIDLTRTPYVRVSWEDRKERTARDYGPPDRSNGPEVERMTLEEESEFYEAHLQEEIPY